MVNFLLLGLIGILNLILGYGWGRLDERKENELEKENHNG